MQPLQPLQPAQPETVPAFVFCFDPSDEFASVGGFDWFWSKDSAQAAFDDACASSHYDADNLSVLEVLVPVSVIRQGSGAVIRFIDEQASLGPCRGVVALLRERPAKTDAQPCTKPCTKPRCRLTRLEPTVTLTQTLHQQLVQLRCQAQDWVAGLPAEGFSPWLGICYQLDLGAPDWGRLDALLAAWPGGTGSRAYPVPHPRFAPGSAFHTSPSQEMWSPEYEYARNRWALLEWLIEQTKPTEESRA